MSDIQLTEPYELQMIEPLFQQIKPTARIDNDMNIIIFSCADEYYKKKIGFMFERLGRPEAKSALKIRAKYKYFKALIEEKKIKQCPDCGDIIFEPKPWKDVCEKCVGKQPNIYPPFR